MTEPVKIRESTETYHGKPCRRCGGTLRYRSVRTCIACAAGYSRGRHERNPKYFRKSLLKREYGMTLEEYDRLLEEQGGACAICGTTDAAPHDYLSVDHCHDSGIVRGLLCSACNKGIGHLRDDPSILREAANYLESA